MFIDQLDSWLGVLANLGVFVGLAFLAMEIRHAGKLSRVHIADSVADGFNNVISPIVSDSQVAKVFIGGLYSPDKLTDAEVVQFAMFMRGLVNQQVRLLSLNEVGLLPESQHRQKLEQLAGMFDTPGGRQYLDSNRHDISPLLLAAVKPYAGQKPKFSFNLGRDTLNLDI